jgi:hypothetical protein
MDPDGFRLIGNRSERTWRGIEKNAYIFNNKFPCGEVIVISSWCNRDAMRYEGVSENTRREVYFDR